jgi:hypothetical protein
MATNGRRHPPHPKLRLVAPDASPQEAAAIAAAIEQFVLDTAPPSPLTQISRNPWQRAGLVEGVSRADGFGQWG